MEDPELKALIKQIKIKLTDDETSPFVRLYILIDYEEDKKNALEIEALEQIRTLYKDLINMIYKKDIITHEQYIILENYENAMAIEYQLNEKWQQSHIRLRGEAPYVPQTECNKLSRRLAALITQLENAPIHTVVAAELEKFIGSFGADTSLIYSYGFSGAYYQIFPQDSEFIEKVFNQHKKNVILAFETTYADGSGIAKANDKTGVLFSAQNSNNSTNTYNKQLKRIFRTVFKLTEDPIKEIISDKIIKYKFTANGNEILFIWIREYTAPETIILYYHTLLQKIKEKILIDTTSCSTPSDVMATEPYYTNTFDTIMVGCSGNVRKNLRNFKEWAQRKSRKNNWTWHKKNNIWTGFGGKRRTRRNKK